MAKDDRMQSGILGDINPKPGTEDHVVSKKDLANLAIPPLIASVENDPRNASYRYHLGLAYLKVGEAEKARDAFEVALRLQPDMKEAREARQALMKGERAFGLHERAGIGD